MTSSSDELKMAFPGWLFNVFNHIPEWLYIALTSFAFAFFVCWWLGIGFRK